MQDMLSETTEGLTYHSYVSSTGSGWN